MRLVCFVALLGGAGHGQREVCPPCACLHGGGSDGGDGRAESGLLAMVD